MLKSGSFIEHLKLLIISNKNLILFYLWCLMSDIDLFANPGKTYLYNGMSSRHLATWARKHLNLNKTKSAIKDHLQQCKSCSKSGISLYWSFTILKKCSSEYSPKIHEANHFLVNSYIRMLFLFAQNIFIYLSYSVTIYQSLYLLLFH